MSDQPLSSPKVSVALSAPTTLFQRLADHAATRADDPVILGDDIPALSYGALFTVVQRFGRDLHQRGFGPSSRIALIMPPGPEMAVAISALASWTCCVPLNPKLGRDDWQPLFADFDIDALMILPGTADAADRAARQLGLPLLTLDDRIGLDLVFDGPPALRKQPSIVPGGEDDAFILPTSGTTSAPKAVPLTHANIYHSASSTAAALSLTSDDRLLSALPLHHAHGLISGLMSSLVAGASIAYMRQFAAPDFFAGLTVFRPTWFTAVPAIHQAIIAEAPRQGAHIRSHRLRFIRSASASLSVARFEALEALFNVPVIETFGMTEAASQVASTPLPPGQRKPGSVGIASGPEIRILDDSGTLAPTGQIGELALRGPNVTRGYVSPGAEPIKRDQDGWFLTGDLGYLDADGYLFITGRLKELINRGGEKLSPLKIEAVLLSHPDVDEAVAFSVPHPRLGEDVGAAVVLRENAALTKRGLRAFTLASEALAEAEIPRHLVIVDAIPKTVTGKVRRTSMAEILNVGVGANAPHIAFVPPETEREQVVAAIWEDVFATAPIGRNDDFFAVGGDSLLAVQVALRVAERCDVMLSLRSLFDAPTVAELAAQIDQHDDGTDHGFHVEPQKGGSIQGGVTPAQAGILALESGFAGFPVFVQPFAYRLTGALDVSAFETSIKRLIARHNILRTTFRNIGGKWQTSPSAAVNVRLEAEDWRAIPDDFQWSFVDSSMDDEIWAGLDVTRMAGIRFRLMRFDGRDGEDQHVLMLMLHHIIMDAWTVKIMLEELFADYDAVRSGDLSPHLRPEVQFADYVRWQQGWLKGKDAAHQLTWWRDQLSGATSVFGVEAPSRTSFATGRMSLEIPATVLRPLADLAKGQGATLYMALLAGLQSYMAHRHGRPDVTVATPIANRTRPNTDAMLGLIENTVAIRSQIDPAMTFRHLLSVVRETVLDAHAHQEMPFELLVQTLRDDPACSEAALSDIYFSVVDHNEPPAHMAGLMIERIELGQDKNAALPVNAARFMFLLKRQGDRVAGSCIYKEDQIGFDQVDDMIEGFLAHLSSLAEHPDESLSAAGLGRCA